MSRPFAPHLFSMTLRDGLFLHWPFAPEAIRPHVPEPLELDTYDGRAWVSFVPFVLADAGLRFSPSVSRLTFPELNVRTYVRFDGVPGLYFFSIDVGHPLVPLVVGRATRLPCYYADADLDARGGNVDFTSVREPGKRERERGTQRRARFEATYRPDGERFRAERGTLDFWLAERRRMYDPAGERVLYAEIAHDPWPLQPAEVTVHANTLFEENALPTPEREPRARYSGWRRITGSVPRWIRSLEAAPHVRPVRLAHR